jgi:MFS transporter, DHA2 family, multidrug resistance protein
MSAAPDLRRLPPPAPAPAPARAARYNPWAIALTVTLATFMEVLDTSIANVALPHIAGGLSASIHESTWVLTSYLVANAIVLPISGWIAGVFGRKRFYMACVSLFTISSLLCGLAPSLGMLILFRVLQGAGGGGLQPSEQSILADTFAPEKLGMAFAIYGMAVVLAPAIGPTLGGYITDNFNWRWIFFINVPVGIVSLALTQRMVEDPPYLKLQIKEARRARIDFPGLALITLGLGTLQVVLDRGQQDDWFRSHFIAVMAAVAAVCLVLFVVWELRQRYPVVDLRMLGKPNFAMSNVMIFVLGVVLYGSTVLIPQYLQELMGYSAEQAGMVLSPGGLVVIAILPIVGFLLSRVEARWLIACGFVVSALALYWMTALNPAIDFRSAMMYRIYQSVGIAFLFIPINTIAYFDIPREKSREVSSMINLFRNVGGSVGISMVETMLARRTQFHQDHMITHLTNYDGALRGSVQSLGSRLFAGGLSHHDAANQALARIYGNVQLQATAQAYVDIVWIFALACLLMVPLVLLLRGNIPGQTRMAAH